MSKIVDQMCRECMWRPTCEKGKLIQAVCLAYKESQEDINTLTAERDALIAERSKERAFVEHIKNHLKTMDVGNDVECRICDKTIDEIYKQEKTK